MRINFSAEKNEAFFLEVIPPPFFPLDDAVRWIQEELNPEDVFTSDQLEIWAEENGYVAAEYFENMGQKNESR